MVTLRSDIGNIPATSEITLPKKVYLQRREFIKNSLLFAATSSGVGSTLLCLMRGLRAKDHDKTTTAAATRASGDNTALTVARHFDYAPGEKNTSYNGVTNYNNFYEFGTDKSDPAATTEGTASEIFAIYVESDAAVVNRMRRRVVITGMGGCPQRLEQGNADWRRE